MTDKTLADLPGAHWAVGSHAAPPYPYQEPHLSRSGIAWPGLPEQRTPRSEASIMGLLLDTGNRVVFSRLGLGEIVLRRPLALKIEREPGGFLVESAELDVYGVGDTLSTAIEDFQHTLQELFDRLNEPDARLGPALREQRETINAHVGRIHA